MSDRKQIAIIFLAAFAIAFGGLVYMAGEIDKMAQADKVSNKVGTVDIQTFCSEGLEPTPSFCKNTLKVAENAPQQQLKVSNDYTMQPFAVGAEDDDTAQLHVQPTYNPQVTAHSDFIQCPMRVDGQRDLLGAKLQ
jgi:hypothetical protein